jgi:hypothetical protein
MDRRRFVAATLALALTPLQSARAQDLRAYSVPSTAVIRGENIWLRVDPRERTATVGYLQRGDVVILIGEAVTAGTTRFVPIETTEGRLGWVRDLAIDPSSVRALGVVAPEPVVVQGVDEPRHRQNMRDRRDQRRGAAGGRRHRRPTRSAASTRVRRGCRFAGDTHRARCQRRCPVYTAAARSRRWRTRHRR